MANRIGVSNLQHQQYAYKSSKKRLHVPLNSNSKHKHLLQIYEIWLMSLSRSLTSLITVQLPDYTKDVGIHSGHQQFLVYLVLTFIILCLYSWYLHNICIPFIKIGVRHFYITVFCSLLLIGIHSYKAIHFSVFIIIIYFYF